MAAKKKKVAAKAKKKPNSRVRSTFAKRSAASKKGWVTRRARVTAKKKASDNKKKLKNAQLGLPKKRRKKQKRLNLEGKSVEELHAIIRQQEQAIEVAEMTKGWVDAMPPEYLHRNGSIALYPSRARHMGKVTDTIVSRLKRAERDGGQQQFEYECYEIAEEYDIPAREIFTLGLSDWTE